MFSLKSHTTTPSLILAYSNLNPPRFRLKLLIPRVPSRSRTVKRRPTSQTHAHGDSPWTTTLTFYSVSPTIAVTAPVIGPTNFCRIQSVPTPLFFSSTPDLAVRRASGHFTSHFFLVFQILCNRVLCSPTCPSFSQRLTAAESVTRVW